MWLHSKLKPVSLKNYREDGEFIVRKMKIVIKIQEFEERLVFWLPFFFKNVWLQNLPLSLSLKTKGAIQRIMAKSFLIRVQIPPANPLICRKFQRSENKKYAENFVVTNLILSVVNRSNAVELFSWL